jgi:probable HAF family extracellular repeat protein
MRSEFSPRWLGLWALLVCPTTINAAEFIPIGSPPGEFASVADGISPEGSFVVGWGDRSQAKSFRWSQSGMILLPDLPGAIASGALDVSAGGSAIVGSASFSVGREAYRWAEGQGIVGLGFLPGFEHSSVASGISSDGSVVVGSSSDVLLISRAFRWTQTGGMDDLGLLSTGDVFGSARSVSANGAVVVGVSGSETTARGFRWTQTTGMQALDSLPGNDDSFATAISADGSVVVGRSLPEAVRWTDAGGVQGLGTLPGHDHSYAVATSGDGSVIVGMSELAGSDVTPFLWTESAGVLRIDDILIDSGVDLTGWTLENVRAISDDGNSIVGGGINPDGIEEGWLARLESSPDFNGDGLLNCLDIDALVAEIVAGANGAAFDLTNDGKVDIDDLDQWRVQGGAANLPSSNPYLVGDANLDGAVGGEDFITWNDHKFTSVAAWCSGDFNADGTVNGQDFDLWNDNKFLSSDNVFAVPEPSTGVFLIAAVFGWAIVRRFSLPTEFLFLVVAISMGATTLSAAQFIPLGDLPGGSFDSDAWGISADGSVVVGSSQSANGREAFLWTQNEGMKGLGDLPGGPFQSIAFGVSDDGSVIAGQSLSRSDRVEPFRWTETSGILGLGFLPGLQNDGAAWDVSSDGSVIVGSSRSGSDIEAFRWTEGGEMQGLGDLPGGRFRSDAWGLSADGSIVVGGSVSASSGDSRREAFRWSKTSGLQGFGDLPGGLFDSSFGDVSHDGAVLVGYGTSERGREAVRWTEQTGWQPLGDLPGGNFYSQALKVAANGSVVVGLGATDVGTAAFMWDDAHGMRDIRDVLTAAGVDMTGWNLSTAYGVSADGTAIVGFGRNPAGEDEGWLVRLDAAISPDFNGDGILDCIDIDALVAEIVSEANGADFDLTGDGLVDIADLDQWRVQGGAANLLSGNPYLVGDATLNGIVDGLDYIAWNDHKFTSVAAWCSGDFNADGTVNGDDFVLWNANKFMSSDSVSAVPEPSTVVVLFAAVLGLAVVRRCIRDGVSFCSRTSPT